MKILKNFPSLLLVIFLISIFFTLINSSSTYASSSVRYWSYTDWSATYEGHTTYPIKISRGPKTDSLMTKNAVCIEAGYSAPGYSVRTTNLGTLYEDDEIWEKEPDFYYFAQKLYSNYDSLKTITGTSYDSFAIAHMALSRKHKNHLCNIGSKKCKSVVDNKIVKKIDELSNPTTCYKMYLVENDSSQDAFYADTGTTVTCPSSETTSTYSVQANVTDGTTTKNASNSTSSSPYTYEVANGFSSLTLTFGGTITRGSGSTYTDNVAISYGIGTDASAITSLGNSVSVGSSANTSSNTTVTVTPGTSTSSSTTGNSITVAPDGTTPNICRTIKISPTSYSSISGGSGNGSSQVCVKVHRAADVVKYAAFTGEVTGLTETSGNLTKSGSDYYTYAESGSSTFKVSGRITRKNDSTDNYSNNASSRYLLTGTAQSASAYGLSWSSPSVTLSRGSNTTQEASFTGSWSGLAKGGETTVCGYLYYDLAVTYTNNSISAQTPAAATQKCVKIHRYTDVTAKFSGSTSLGTMDSSLVCGAESNNTKSCTGIASKGTYSVGFSNSVSRTADASSITDAGFKYAVNKNGTDTTAQTSTLKVNTSKNDGGLGANSVNVSVSESDTADQTVTYCQYVKYNTKTAYFNGSPVTAIANLTMDGSSTQKCVKITRPKNFYNNAKFSGTISSLSSTDSKLVKSGNDYYTYEASGTASFVVKGSISRQTASNGDNYGSNAASRYNLTLTSQSSAPYGISSSSPNSGLLARGGNSGEKSATINASWNNLAKGGSVEVCGYLYYDSQITYKNGGEASRSQAAATQKCVTIHRYTNVTAKFSGSTSLGTMDDSLVCGNESNNTKSCTGIASKGTYSVGFSHSVSRNGDGTSITDAAIKYAVNKNGTDDTAKTSTLKINTSKTNDGLGANSVNVSVSESDSADQKVTYCQNVKYNTSSTYYNGKLINSSGTEIAASSLSMNGSSTQKCVEITRPKNFYNYAKFDSGLKISETSGYLVSCSPNELGTASAQNKTIECTGPAVQSNFTLTFEYIVNRKNDSTDTYSGSALANSNAGAVLSEGAFSNSQYTSTLGLSTGALAKGNSKTVKTEASKKYTIKPGENKTICAYLTYNNSLKIKNNVSVVERSNANAYKCIKITNPNPQTPVSFTGTSATPSLTDASYFTKKSNGEYYITKAATLYPSSSAITSSDNKYRVSYSHTVKRDDVSNYTSSNQYKYITSAAPNSYKAQTGSGTDIFGLSYSDNFSITSAGVGDSKTKANTVSIFLPSGTKKTNCQKINYQTPVTILYSTQAVVGTPPRVSSTQACITLANPIYEYEYRDPENREIVITPSTTIEHVTNVVESSGSTRTTKNAQRSDVYMKHTLARGSDGFSDLVNPAYTGKIGFSGTTFSTSGFGSIGNLASGGSWNSSRTNNTSSVFSSGDVLAGTANAKRICSNVISSPGNYTILFGTRYRRETYVDGTPTTSWEQDSSTKVRVPKTSDKIVRPSGGNDASKYGNPQSPKKGTDKTGTQSCVTITRPYNFKISDVVPSGTTDVLDDNEEASTPEFSITVKRNEANSQLDYITDLSSKNVKIISFVVDTNTLRPNAGALLDGGVRSNDNFCSSSNYTVKAPLSSNCKVENPTSADNDNITRVGSNFSSGTSYLQKVSVFRNAPANLEIGDKFCIALAISPISDSDNNWKVSPAYCRVKSKKPTMQVLGGSVLARGGINTSQTTSGTGSNKLFFGSWGDFALIANGKIKKMASGAAFSGGLTNITNGCDYSPLTLANNSCTSSLGEVTQTLNSSDYYRKVKERLVPSIQTLLNGSERVGVGIWDNGYSFTNEQFSFERYNANNRYYILFKKNGQSLPNNFMLPNSGRADNKLPIRYSHSSMRRYFLGDLPVIFYSAGNMEITSNFINDVDDEARQIVIIADGDIIIDENVTRIDAWIISGGDINTCSINGVAQTASTLNSEKCTKQLTINGPVYAKSIYFSRTYGNDSDSLGTPAEIIDSTPSTLIWSYNLSKEANTPNMTYLKELAPRQ